MYYPSTMRHFFYFLLLGWTTLLPAQQPSTIAADTARTNRLLRVIRILIETEQPSQALAKLDTARLLVEHWPGKSSREYAEILFHTGVCYRKKADYPRAIDYLQEALERR